MSPPTPESSAGLVNAEPGVLTNLKKALALAAFSQDRAADSGARTLHQLVLLHRLRRLFRQLDPATGVGCDLGTCLGGRSAGAEDLAESRQIQVFRRQSP